MTDEEKFERVRSFLEERIDSVEQLHVLILLRRDPERTWTVRAISEELRSVPASVEKRLRSLVDRKVLDAESIGVDQIRYRSLDLEVEAQIGELLAYYREKPHRVVNQIFSQPRNAIRSLADAFKFRKD